MMKMNEPSRLLIIIIIIEKSQQDPDTRTCRHGNRNKRKELQKINVPTTTATKKSKPFAMCHFIALYCVQASN